MGIEQKQFFLVGPALFIDRGIKVVVPTLPTLLTCPVDIGFCLAEPLGNSSPVIVANIVNNSPEQSVFLYSSSVTAWLQFFLIVVLLINVVQ